MDYYIIGLLVTILGIVISLMYRLGKIEERLGRIEDDLRKLTIVIYNVGIQIIEYLGLRKILTSQDVDYLKATPKGLTTNPFTEAERKRLTELIDKDDLTPEEADELERLAIKFFDEYISKNPDAWKVLFYAAYKRGETYGKYGKN